ncbi:MAG: adenylate/guanylate cyclase domain-containing protein, partial [Bacteroidales bacterium]|nr:adenylate/guanylate cyclase domain-containing protein [Bacteroidales bacterium]
QMVVNFIDKTSLTDRTYFVYTNPDQKSNSYPLSINQLNDLVITMIKKDNEGSIWIGGINQLIRYNPDIDFNHRDSVYLFFTRILIGGDSVIYNLSEHLFAGKTEKTKSPKISHNKNSISFNFSSTDFISENKLRFKYKLDGLENKWSDWTSVNNIQYNDLYEGKYTFRVKAKNIFEKESPEIEYHFIIKPPFYRTGVAYFIYMVFLTFIGLIIIKWRAYYFARERFKLENIINERTEEVVIQKEKAENLLERVLPKTTATELKSGKKAGPYHYNMVTVLFSDIQGFTKISEQLNSEMLIDELDKFFMKFDSVVDKYNIEKIKTIGDAYMCAGGIPEKNRTNPVEVVLAAIEMQNYMKTLKHEKGDGTQRIWDLRIGIDTGPVVAGVLGRNKISYDIWGGTVNTASRMEAAGEPGKVNITENTYMLIKEFFICQYRGKMPVKYKGELDMYFVESFMPHLASDIKGLYPNESFFTQLQLLRLNDIEEFVLTKLETGLPKNLYYHNIKHTIDVVTQVELIGRSEKISDEDMLLLKTAALFHDMGHLIDYDTHEEESVKLAKKILPAYHYNEKQIEQIARLIMCTQMPPEPKDVLEEIMCDADLDYLGRADFVPVSVNLFKELRERNKIDSLHEWNNHQTKFIQGHQYFTQTARKLREVNKNKQLDIIRTEIRKAIEAEDE